jgi:deferrochelatase/peroxidase EfeB
VIGRTKLESIELDDEIQPENSHVSRTVVEDGEVKNWQFCVIHYLWRWSWRPRFILYCLYQ